MSTGDQLEILRHLPRISASLCTAKDKEASFEDRTYTEVSVDLLEIYHPDHELDVVEDYQTNPVNIKRHQHVVNLAGAHPGIDTKGIETTACGWVYYTRCYKIKSTLRTKGSQDR